MHYVKSAPMEGSDGWPPPPRRYAVQAILQPICLCLPVVLSHPPTSSLAAVAQRSHNDLHIRHVTGASQVGDRLVSDDRRTVFFRDVRRIQRVVEMTMRD
jgi:hypothetical protein